jgi:hypothetical protein
MNPADAERALDHVIVAGPDLAALGALLSERTGVASVAGGRHVGHGTHNALAGLGAGRYLELLAPDPSQEGGGFAATIAHLTAPALHTWCGRGGSASAIAARITAAGATPRRLPMSRLRADGSELAWELVFVDDHPYGTLVPFFVDWRGATHPSSTLPAGLELERLELRHPDPGGLRALLTQLGGVPDGVVVAAGDAPRIAATIRGERAWTLDGDARPRS